jgi:hypothetical protein
MISSSQRLLTAIGCFIPEILVPDKHKYRPLCLRFSGFPQPGSRRCGPKARRLFHASKTHQLRKRQLESLVPYALFISG